MKLHIIPSQEFTQLLLAIIHGLANHKAEPQGSVGVSPASSSPESIDHPPAIPSHCPKLQEIADPVLAVFTLFGIELDTFQKAKLRAAWFQPKDPAKPNATTDELQAILSAMKKVMGNTKLKSNFEAPLPDPHLSTTAKEQIIDQKLKQLVTGHTHTFADVARNMPLPTDPSDPDLAAQSLDAQNYTRNIYEDPQEICLQPAAELPELHAGLTFPLDERMIRWFSDNAPKAIDKLGGPTREGTQEQRTNAFQNLRHLARHYGRTDEELIASIICFARVRDKAMNRLAPLQLIDVVTTSLKAAQAAEIAEKEADAKRTEASARAAARRYTLEEAIEIITEITKRPTDNKSERDTMAEIQDIIHRTIA